MSGPQKTLHQLFEERVNAQPDAVAVTCGETNVTYRQLDDRADRLARLLRTTQAIEPDNLVAIVQDRSEHVLISMLAVLKSGGAYVPIDPNLPDELTSYILRDTNVCSVLTNVAYGERLRRLMREANLPDAGVVAIDSEATQHRLSGLASGELKTKTESSHLAYVIYTSGTTGRPKGVMIEHRAVVNYIRNVGEHIGLSAADTCDYSTNLSFDLTVTTTLACLVLGGQVAVYDGQVQDLDSYKEFLRQQRVSFIKLTPNYFALLAADLPATQVSKVVLGGEKLAKNVLHRIRARPDRRLVVYDEYGPTETTVGACFSQVFPLSQTEPNIGRLYDNYAGYVLDTEGRRVPDGEIGELFIGGAGLARGYLNSPDLTAERFVANPFQTLDEERQGHNPRIYKTGDLVRRLPAGDLEYIGRNDLQVKIRGYRIELGAIEDVLHKHGDVAQAAVVAQADGAEDQSKRLVAFVVPGEFGCSSQELEEHLSRMLPEYMLPSGYVFLDAMPLSRNGKIDRQALLTPQLSLSESYVAPRTELEHAVCEVWSELLHYNDRKLGVNDEFFKLGGDSIISIQLLSRLRQRLGVQITIKELFEHNTIGKLCEYLSVQRSGNELVPAGVRTEQGALSGPAPLLPIQKWFFDSDFARPNHWNQAFLIRTPELDVDRLRASVRELGKRHDAFRLRYRRTESDEVIQFYTDEFEPTELVVASRDGVSDDSFRDLLTVWQSNLDLREGPVYRIGYVDGLADGDARILVACHHLVVDAISWRILAEDLQDLYYGKDLPVVGSSYRQWAQAVGEYPSEQPEERGYWIEVMDGFSRTGDDAVRKLVRSEDTRTVSGFELDRDATRRLVRDSNHAFGTQINDILLTAFAHALVELTGERANYVVLEGHGREEIAPRLDVARTVGWFTTMFPVRLEVGSNYQASLRNTKEMLRGIPAKGIGYGAFFGYDNTQLPRINFNYLGQFGNDDTPTSDSQWRITREVAGEAVHTANHDNNIMTINGLILDGRLTFTIVNKLGQTLGDLVVSRFKQAMVELVDELAAMERAYLTPSDVDHIVSREYLDEIQREREVDGVYLANSLQQGFIYHAITQGQVDDAYIVQTIWSYATEIEPDALREAWCSAQRRFPSLRLRFGWQEDLVQIIDTHGTVDWRYVDLSHESDAQQDESVRRIREADRAEAYDLSRGSLFRVHLLKLHERRYTCIFSSHHSILDGWSNTLLLNHVHAAYQDVVENRLPESSPDYGYTAAQRYLQQHRHDHDEFWRSYLAAYDQRMDLQGLLGAAARSRGVVINETRRMHDMRDVAFTLSGEELRSIKRLAQESGFTLNALLVYVWHAVLNLYGGADQTISGLVLSGRGIPTKNIENSVGLLINTLPLLVHHADRSQVVIDGVKAVQRDINELNARSSVDLASLYEGTGRLFDTLFIYENWPKLGQDGWRARLETRFEGEFEKLDYSLAAIVSETPNDIQFRLSYANGLFDARYIEDMLRVQRQLLDEVVARIQRPRRELQFLTPEQHNRVNTALNPPGHDHAADVAFHTRFEAQVEQTPERIAVTFVGESLTYRELNERANRLADLLERGYRVRPEQMVVLCMEKGLDLLVSMLAVMKLEAAYVPLDPAYPDERIKHILGDTASPIVLTSSDHRARLEDVVRRAGRAAVVALDTSEVAEALAAAHDSNPPTAARGATLMYVLYTSGTTGMPKGVMIEHRSFCLILDAIRARHFAHLDSVSTFSMTNHVFDIFGLEYGLPLVTGGRVELADMLPETLDCRSFDFVQMTPSVCDLLLDRLTGTSGTLLLLGGERLSGDLLDRALARSIDVVNMYGPTETTIWSTSRLYRHTESRADRSVSLGLPFDNESVHVLDAELRPLPIGAIGELCIGGYGLARGYLNQAALTAEKFIADPWLAGARLYRTGDLVRLLSDGELEFVGRNDFQVKIRGHRIELGEVEMALSGYPGVRQCVVVVQDVDQRLLVGYYVSDHGVEADDLARHLRASLPDFMVPDACIRLEAMPLTINGKVDRKALPEPDFTSGRVHVAPRNSLDRNVREILARLLGRPVDDVGIDDDFFQLGGNSILSIKLVTALRKEIGILASAAYLLAHRTVREFVDDLGRVDHDDEHIKPASTTKPEDQVLSFAQERLWFIEKFEGGTNAYNIPLIFGIDDRVDTAVLTKSIHDLLRRHEILRTLIKEDADGIGYQVVQEMPHLPAEIATVVVDDLAAMHAELCNDAHYVFDLSRERPLRARLYQTRDVGQRYLSLVIHHIAFDGWSIDILLQDLGSFYALNQNAIPGSDPVADLPAPALQYRDFAAWQRGYLSEQRTAALLRFWEDKLRGFENLDLITDRGRPERTTYAGADLHVDVDVDLSHKLRERSRELEVSLFSLLLSGYYLALKCFSNQDDIVVGSPIANRDHPQLERLVGFFVNTLPLRSHIESSMPIADYIQHTAREVLEVLQYQELPFERLVDALDVPRDASRHPIFQVTFGLQSFGAPSDDAAEQEREILWPASGLEDIYTAARFDLSTVIDDSRDALHVRLNYSTSLFDGATIASFAQTYLEILRQFALPGEQRSIAELSYISDATYREIVRGWSAPHGGYESDALLHALFEQQAERDPDRVALVWKDTRRTYRELNVTANKLAHHLLGHCEIEPDALVVLCLDRSDNIILSILATLKAGAAYVPVDPAFPDDRIEFILQDTRATTVITNEHYVDRFAAIMERLRGSGADDAAPNVNVLAIDDVALQARLDAEPADNPVTTVTGDNIAYLLFTSGTTGRPKGVPQSHANVVRLFRCTEGIYSLRPDDVWTFFHSYVFDFTIWEMWGAFIYGGRLVVPSFEETRDPALFYELCHTEGVTVLCQTPTAFYPFMEVALSKGDHERLDELRYAFFGGEALNVSLLKPWFERYSYDRPRLAAGYGTTETTVFTCYKLYGETDDSATDIGFLLPDVAGYVLDSQLRPLPVGAVGELFIGGEGLAHGYLNRPELTQERFIANPFQCGPHRNDRLYRSGDLVRWAPDGSLEYVRRNDFQVKVRGHRIELGEIEAALSVFPDVKQCAIVPKRQTDAVAETYLVGYYVAEHDLDADAMFEHLRIKLPDYMIPTALVRIRELPRTISGKLDTRALPEPRLKSSEDFAAPRNALEVTVRAAMAHVLGVDAEQISVLDDFFRLGGNSILTIKLAGHLSRQLNANISIASLFRHRSVADLAKSLESAGEKLVNIDKPAVRDESAQVLSFAQERLWFIDRYEQGTDAYNIHLCYEVLPSVNIEILERSFRAIYQRHEVLRTVIKQNVDGESFQAVLDDKRHPLEITHVTLHDALDLSARAAREATYRFDLSAESPFKVSFYTQGRGQHRQTFLGILVHHIAFDGWSVDLLLEELGKFYAYFSSLESGDETSLDLPELTIQYRDFAAWQRGFISGERLSKLVTHWRARLEALRVLDLPTDHRRPTRVDYRGARVTFEVDRDVSRALRSLANEANVSLFSVLLTGYYLMLHAFSNQDNLIVGVPVFNRQYDQTHDLIGCFVNSLAIDLQIDSGDDVKTLLQKVAARVIEAQQHQDLPFERLVSELGVASDLSRHPIFQVWFDVNSFAQASSTGLLRAHPLDGYTADGESNVVAKFDLSTTIDDSQDPLIGSMNFAVSLFDKATVERFIETYKIILGQLATASRVADVQYVPREEYQRLVELGRGRERAYPYDKTLAELFREQARMSPSAPAVVLRDDKLTYRQLDEQSDRLADFLVQTFGIGPDALVGLHLTRSVEMIVAIVAIWKAGGAYVPIDPEYPDERTHYILRDSATKVVLCNAEHRARLERLATKLHGVQAIAIDEVQIDAAFSPPPGPRSSSNDLAYVMYTSGTTGQPNGVMIEQRAVVNLKCDLSARYGIRPDSGTEVILQLANYVFDASVEQIVLALLNGKTLLLVPDRLWLEAGEFNAYLNAYGVTHIHATPTFFKQLDIGQVRSLKRLIAGGEVLDSACLGHMTRHNEVDVFNEYGPTETTVTSLVSAVRDRDVTIGRPLDNTSVFVLDADLRPVPTGVVGELFISGAGLARGYLNQPRLTAQRFIPNPFGDRPGSSGCVGARLYKTGDLVRWRSDGDVEYVTRDDLQVKIRGYRIELGEIEAALRNRPAITHSLCRMREDRDESGAPTGDRYLVAYYVSASPLDADELLRSLSRSLPQYMLPRALVHLHALPMTVNGKLDLKALPDPKTLQVTSKASPRNVLEDRIRHVWADVLGLLPQSIGIDDNFFQLGGNSILAVKLASRMNATCDGRLRVADVFVLKTIRGLVPALLRSGHEYRGISALNSGTAGPSMFMVHPAQADSEVYVSLAHALEGQFRCFGVDSHNLHNTPRIESLRGLASAYLELIDTVRGGSGPGAYHLLGWSLGGQVCLEIAVLLEERGVRDVCVYLLDTVLPDARLTGLRGAEQHLDAQRQSYVARAKRDGYDDDYVRNVLNNRRLERDLSCEPLSNTLRHTRVLLFKALAREDDFDAGGQSAIDDHVAGLAAHNVDLALDDTARLQVIGLYGVHHHEVLANEQILADAIARFAALLRSEVLQ